MAIRYAIQAVGVGGLIALSHEAWQGLGDDLKLRLRDTVRAARVWLVSGYTGSGPLRVEDF